jgi:hypothetical protein
MTNRFFALVISICLLAELPAFALTAIPLPRRAQTGDISLTLTLLAEKNTITAGEPLIARATVTNKTNDLLEILNNSVRSYLTVADESGKIVAASIDPGELKRFMGLREAGRRLGGGKSFTDTWIISGLYQFQKPGKYVLNLQRWGDDEKSPILAEARVTLTVLPYDSARLMARGEELFAPVKTHGAMGDIPLTARVKAIYSVRNNIALPYLDWAAKEWADKYAVLAMRRIGTPEATRYISALTARKDSVGKAAGEALTLPLAPTDYDYLAVR